jgi:hypothetical protein
MCEAHSGYKNSIDLRILRQAGRQARGHFQNVMRIGAPAVPESEDGETKGAGAHLKWPSNLPNS